MKAFVTVKEFFENKGEIPLETPLYGTELAHTQIGEFGGLATLDGEMVVVKQSNKSFPFYSSLCTVEIDVTPHYVIPKV